MTLLNILICIKTKGIRRWGDGVGSIGSKSKTLSIERCHDLNTERATSGQQRPVMKTSQSLGELSTNSGSGARTQ